MKQKLLHSLLDRGIIIVEVGLLVLFVYWKYRLGITRYFDIDEYAHLHWAFNFFSGVKPYSQFLYFFPPLYLLILYPLFVVAGKTFFLLTLARFQAFTFFLFLLITLFLLVRKVRGAKTALLSVVILSFLPIPADKLLEIRPDTISTAIAVLGMLFFIYSLEKNKYLFLSGLCYGLALLIVPKVLFFLPVVLVIVLINFWKKKWSVSDLWTIALGFMPPIIFTLLFFVAMGNPANAIYYSTKFISSASKILGERFPMRPELFFYPNDIFYGEFGINPTLIINLIIYIVAGCWGIIKLVSFLDNKSYRESVIELLLSISFIANFIAFIKFFPMKHTQYFIAFAPFIAFYFSDMLLSLYGILQGKTRTLFLLLFLIFLLFIGYQGNKMNSIKANWNNDITFKHLKTVKDLIPSEDYVFDLYGETIFYKDPYYICCVSYGEYIEAFNRKLPSLADSLRQTQTKYIFTMTNTRLGVLPPLEARFINDHYIKIMDDPVIMVSGVAVKLAGGEEEVIDLIASGIYKIYFNGKEMQNNNSYGISIDGENKITSPMFLEQGDHKVISDVNGELKILYSNKK